MKFNHVIPLPVLCSFYWSFTLRALRYRCQQQFAWNQKPRLALSSLSIWWKLAGQTNRFRDKINSDLSPTSSSILDISEILKELKLKKRSSPLENDSVTSFCKIPRFFWDFKFWFYINRQNTGHSQKLRVSLRTYLYLYRTCRELWPSLWQRCRSFVLPPPVNLSNKS